MSASRVHRDDEVGAGGKRALQKTVVRLVTNNAKFSQRMAEATTLHNFRDKISSFAKHISVFFKYGWTGPRLY